MELLCAGSSAFSMAAAAAVLSKMHHCSGASLRRKSGPSQYRVMVDDSKREMTPLLVRESGSLR